MNKISEVCDGCGEKMEKRTAGFISGVYELVCDECDHREVVIEGR
jgi:hypothetical protein